MGNRPVFYTLSIIATMIATLDNAYLNVIDPTPDFLKSIGKSLAYKDKSKAYQLRRMGRTSWGRGSDAYKKIQAEAQGTLFTELSDGSVAIPTGLYDAGLLDQFQFNLTDSRRLTGTTVALPWVKKPFELRDYQREAVDLMLLHQKGIINFATGLGKTLLAVHFIKEYRKRALIVCPSESVAKQFYKECVDAFGQYKVGFWGDGKKKLNDITIGIAMSVNKDIEVFRAHDLGVVIVDEVHHIPATTFYKIALGLSEVGKVFGLSATDYRSDGKDIMITAGCGKVLMRRDIRWGVENGWLAEPIFIVREVDTTDAKDYKDDKLKSYKAHVLNHKAMKERIEHDVRSMINAGKSVLCLVDQVEHGRELASNLGIPFATGEDKLSQSYVAQLNSGQISGLIGTDSKIGEGTDTKNVDVLVLANFVASKGPVTQCLGRGLRKQGSKLRCYILDYIPTGSTMLNRHGYGRVEIYQEITSKVKVIHVEEV